MDERQAYEKLSIRDSARSSKKYGSTSNRNCTRNVSYIKHQVLQTDTLQGIALKYGVTIEQIRRANRLFPSDSLFLREYLLIPSLEVTSTDLLSPSSTTSSSSTLPLASPSFDDEVEDGSEFLDKIDAAIANTKADFKKIHKRSEFLNGDLNLERRKPAVSRMKQMVNNNGISDTLNPPQTVVVAQGNKIKTSMRRYQQQQDELFEL